jgi:16S rRNA (guanine527-N7)-methyltransferase
MNSDIIFKYFQNLESKQIKQLKQIGDIYTEWNQKINVISRKDIEQIYIHHVLHSLAIAKVISFPENSSILDIGTGGGFPGIPLAILFPNTQFHLVDSIAKKIKVVEEAVNELKLTNVSFEQCRAEKIKTKYDYIISRAVTNFPDFLKLIKKKFNFENDFPNQGLYYLKGGDFDNEIVPYKNHINIENISSFFKEDFFETKKVIYYNPKI